MKKWLIQNVPRRNGEVDVLGVGVLILLLCAILFFIVFLLWTLTTPAWPIPVFLFVLAGIVVGGTYAIKQCVDEEDTC